MHSNSEDGCVNTKLSFDEWYDGYEHVKFALADVILENNDQKPIVFVKSSQWGIELFQEENIENIQGALIKEFNQLFDLRSKTDRDICYVRHIPKIEEGTLSKNGRTINPGHWCVLYFFKDHNKKNSLLFINPGSKKATIVGDVLGAIQPFFQKDDANLYIYGSDVQDDMGSCGPISAEFARALCSMSDEQKKYFMLSLKKANSCNEKINVTVKTHKELQESADNTIKYKDKYYITEFAQDQKYEIKYQTVNLDFLLSKAVIEDFKNNKTTEGKYKGKKCRDAHSFAANLILKESPIKLFTVDEVNEESKKFILNLVNKNPENKIAKIEDILCPVLSSSIMTGIPFLNQEQIQQVNHKREEIFGAKDKKTVQFQLDDERKKDPNTTLSSDTQHTEKSEPVKISLTAIAFVAAVIFFISILADVKKEFKIAGIVISSIMLISAVTCFFFPGKTKDPKLTTNIKTPLITTTTTNVQPVAK